MKSFAPALAFISTASALAVPFSFNGTNGTAPFNLTLPQPPAFDSPVLTPIVSSRQSGNETNSTIPINSTHVPPQAHISQFHPVARSAGLEQVDPVAVLQSLMQTGNLNINNLPAQVQQQLQNINSLSGTDALATLRQVMSSGAININSLPAQLQEQLQSITSLSNVLNQKRENLPLLNCDYDLATHCALYTAGDLQQCMWQAIGGARDAKTDPACIAAANAIGAALPADCKTCLGL